MNNDKVYTPQPEESRSPLAQASQDFMTAVVKMENEAKARRWDKAFYHASGALRAQAALSGVVIQTLSLTVKETQEQAALILELQERVTDLEGRMGNVGRGLEILTERIDQTNIPNELGDSFSGLADRYANTKEKE